VGRLPPWAAALNDTPNPIPIPGTDEVIPPGSFACYNTTDVHYNEELYPNPMKWDPERFREGREEFKKQAYGCEYSRVVPFPSVRLCRAFSFQPRLLTLPPFFKLYFYSNN